MNGDMNNVPFSGSTGQTLLGNANWGTIPTNIWELTGNSISAGSFVGTTNAQDLVVKTQNGERMRITSSGNVGVGDATPAALFTVGTGGLFRVEANGRTRAINGSATTPSYSFYSATATGMFQPEQDHIAFSTGTGIERVRITATGNVGIGITAPAQRLDVSGNVRFSEALMPAGAPGISGQILISRGTDNAPVWDSVRVKKAASQGITLLTNNTPTDILGLSKTFTLNTESMVIVSTYGSLESVGPVNTYSSAQIEVYLNSSPLTDMTSTISIVNNANFYSVIKPWSMNRTMILPAGSHTLKVSGRKLGGQDIRAGSNVTSGANDAKFYEGWLVVTIIPR